MREELKFVAAMSGERCVMMDGVLRTLQWHADNLASLLSVR